MGNYKGIKNKVQVFNPRSHRWMLIDTKMARILGRGREQSYKNVPVKGNYPNA